MKRKICIVTGARAEYGLLKPLMDLIKNDNTFEIQVIVTGTHLSHEFGLTYKEIENDGFIISEKIEILLSADTPTAISKSMGLAVIGFSEAYNRLNPDLIVLLGDRYEIFCASASASIARIPIAHLHGGELTEGAVDEVFRHSITKMSTLHFTSTEVYRKRVIQLGESPDRVFNVGAIGLDNINNLNLLSMEKLEKELDFKFNKRNLLVTFHPVTLENNTAGNQFSEILKVADRLKETNIIFTMANSDISGRIINQMIGEYTSKNNQKAISFISLGQLKYLSTMKYVDAVVGNSSSGIIEAPSFKIGTINIGDRQKGRIKAGSVIDCKPDQKSINNALNCLYSDEFQKKLKSVQNPYGDGHTAERIISVIKSHNITVLKKRFYDINFNLED